MSSEGAWFANASRSTSWRRPPPRSILKLYASDRFAAELDDHVHTEFPKLRDLLKSAPAA